MANQNLSQFTEKTFVADADHTFIWDSAASISKRVSRNSWLSGTTANCRLGLADAATPVAQTLSVQSVVAGTTNTAGAAFTIDGSQGTGTGAGGSLIFRTAAAGSSGSTQNAFGTAMLITADKRVVPTGLTIDGSGLFEIFNDLASAQGRTFPARSASIGRLGICYRADAQIAWSPGNGSSVDGGNMGTADTILLRDAANTLALRNGAAAQTFNIYGTYTSGTSYERLTLSAPSAANAIIGTNKGSGGGTARGLDLHTDGVSRWSISTAGHFTTGTDNAYDIGTNGAAGRPRNVYVANNIQAGNSLFVDSVFGNRGGSVFAGGSDGNMRLTNNAGTDFNRFQLGGTTDSFPAVARDGAGIKFTGAAAGSTSWIKVPPVAVGSLPVAATAGAGARAFVNDALAPTFGSAVTGGGAVLVPVYCTGSAWNVG